MRSLFRRLAALLLLVGCRPAPATPAVDAGPVDAGPLDAGPEDAGPEDAGPPDAGPPDAGAPDAGEPDAGEPDAGPLPDGGLRLRLLAGNLSSGNRQSYDPGEGTRIFQGLKPDVVLIQEFNDGTNTATELRAFVDHAFGKSFQFYRQPGVQLPNGVISRYPLLAAGDWADPEVSNRAFTWAHLRLPGSRDLWAISLHLLTSSGSSRQAEATALVALIQQSIPAGDLLVVGGDLNTSTLSESALATLDAVVDTGASPPVDQSGDGATNSSRNHPYDHLFFSPALQSAEVPVEIGGASFPVGLVFDSRVYAPLSDVAPVQVGDSGAVNMQHMAVVREVLLGP